WGYVISGPLVVGVGTGCNFGGCNIRSVALLVVVLLVEGVIVVAIVEEFVFDLTVLLAFLFVSGVILVGGLGRSIGI
ncbi:2127_t:CDS:2, partial [Dentiscutata heterogama]